MAFNANHSAGQPILATDMNAIETALNSVTKQWLVVDGIYIREGSSGPIYRTTGYNCYVMKAAGGTTAQTMNAAQRDTYFASLRPNSLTRVWAYAPLTGFTWAQVLAELDAIVASAKEAGQRLIFTLTGWGSAANDAFGGKTQAWLTARTWRTSVSGSTSLQAWTETVVNRYKDEPTVCIYDLCNEPQDTGAAYNADLVLYGTEMKGYVKTANPNALVYTGIQYASAIGGTTQFSNYVTNMDFVSYHNYDATGYMSVTNSAASAAITLGKPLLVDEFGVWAKQFYGTTSDTDKDTNGLPAVNFDAQAELVRSFIETAFALPNTFGALIWSYMDSDASWYDGLGWYEPINQSETRNVINTVNLFDPSPLASNKLSTLTTWIDAIFTLRYAPGTQIGGPNSGTTALNLIYDRVGANYRQSTQANAPTSSHAFAWPSLLFSGNSSFPTTASTGAGGHHIYAVLALSSLPSAFGYIVAPSSATNGFAVRINSAGNVQLVNYGSGTAVVIGTGTTALTVGKLYIVEVRWDAVGGTWRIRVNGVSEANGTTTATLSTDVMVVGAAPGNTLGFTGHILEIMKFSSSISVVDQSKVNAYLQKKYRDNPVVDANILTRFVNGVDKTVVGTTRTTSFTVTESDTSQIIPCNSGSAITVTFPVLTTGHVSQYVRVGSGTVTFANSGTTFVKPTDLTAAVRIQGAIVTAVYLSSTSVLLMGELT